MVQPSDPRERLERGDKPLFVVPWVNHKITINEAHAVLMGSVGLLLGVAYSAGHDRLALTGAILLAMYAIVGKPAFKALGHDHPEYEKSIGMKTIRHEPWWFVPPLLATFLIGMVI